MVNKLKDDLHFNIEYSFNEEGKKLKEIIEELFLLNLKELNI
mgnify:CR=1 FL=1